MSIKKRAAVLTDVRLLSEKTAGVDMQRLVKEAAARLSIDANSRAKQIVDAEIEKHPTALFFRARAIVADETNSNGDFFSCAELIKAAGTFVGVPFYTNHENQDITKAKGKIVFSEWDPKEKAIYVIGFIDREAYPGLCRGVEQDYMRGVSMGCVVEYSECSICDNQAATVEEYCPHIKFRKGRMFSGTAKSVKTGEIRNFKNAHVYERNFGVRFIELSGVGDPACKSCRIQGVYDNEGVAKAASCLHSAVGHGHGFLSKVASVENSLSMYRETDLYKQASQQELQQIEEVLKTLETISVNLIKNRKRVEVEYASDLVQILSELQVFADELTGAGYGQLQDETGGEAGGIPGVEGGNATSPLPLPGPADGVPSASGGTGMPVSDILGGGGATPSVAPLSGGTGGVGTVSGSPSQPRVSAPRMPTAPKKPLASSGDRLLRIAELMTVIKTALEEGEDEGDMNRRIPNTASVERASIRHAMADSMKESTSVPENVVVHGDSTNVSGGAQMLINGITQTAARTEAPSVLQEKQLDANLANHPRTGVEQTSTQQVQLDPKRKDSEPQTTIEDQLKGSRKDDAPGVLPEKQLAGLRKEDEPNSTQQVQLEPHRTGTEQEKTTEAQLDGKQGDLYARAAFKRQKVKTADHHVASVIRSVAESAVRCSATPQMIRSAVASLVANTKTRTSTLDLITSISDEQVAAASTVVARARYWGGKGVTLASVTVADMRDDLVAGLRQLVAQDMEISPEAVMDVLDVVGNDDGSMVSLSNAIDDVLAEPQEVAASASMKSQIRIAVLAPSKVEKVDQPPVFEESPLVGTNVRVKEREKMKAALASKCPTHIIEASFKEIGTTAEELLNDKAMARKKIRAFVDKVSKMNNLTVEQKKAGVLVASKVKSLKIANITNVTVDGAAGSVQIAIQTEEGDTKADVTLPLDGQGADVVGAPAEGDATGEGLDALVGNEAVGGMGGADLRAPPAPAGGAAPVAPAPNAPLPTAASKKPVKTAQVGGAGGGLPGGGNLGGAQDPGSALPQGMPAMDSGEGLQNFTEDKKEGDEDKQAPGVGEQMMPGSICPFCHGSDTTTGKKELPQGAFECNNCGAVYEVHVNIEVLNPEGMSFEKGDSEDGVTEPKLPEMPVAAVTKLDKAGLEKVASCEQKYGHVCPACGMTECKPKEKTAGKVVYVCPSCETQSTKELLVTSDKTPFLQVAWTLNPKKVFSANCESCKKAALEYVALMKVTSMMKKADQANKTPSTAFPAANCAEYIARRFGGNAVATNGPCKGKPLSDCVCKQLESFGLRQRRDVEKLAAVYAKPDLFCKCLDIWKGKGYKQAQAETMCKAMQKKYAKESDTNEWLEAFAGDSRFTTEELRIMKQKSSAMLKGAQAGFAPGTNMDTDLGAPLDDVMSVADEGEGEGEGTVTVEIPEATAKDIADQIGAKVEETEAIPEEIAPLDGLPVEAKGKGKAPMKTAATPKKVEDISSGVEGKVKGGKGTIGNESAKNIDVEARNPVIPSNEGGSKIKGEKETIPEATLPDIPQDNSLMGDEASTQKGMPAINIDMRGRVIAEAKPEALSKEAATPKKVEDISSGVEGKVKGGKGTIGNEGKDNINVDANKPSIPSNEGGSKIGGEKETIPDATLPDIAQDNSLIGGEKETQKGMPAINTDIRGRVIADGKRDQQIAKIAAARHKKACQVAAKLMGMGRIAESDYDAVVEDLSKIEVDRIEAFAERMYKSVRLASTAPSATLSMPIVQEASVYSPKMQKTMAEELKGIFTIGTSQLHQRVLEDDRRDAQTQE